MTHGQYRGDPIVNDPYTTYATFIDPMPPQPTRPYSPQTMDPGVEFDDQGLSVQIDWDITDNLSLKWISAMREYHDIFAYDTDGSPFFSQGGTQGLDHEHTSHEVRLTGVALNDRLDYTAGAYYVDQSKAQHIGQINLYYTQLNFVHGPDLTPSDSHGHLRAHGVASDGQARSLARLPQNRRLQVLSVAAAPSGRLGDHRALRAGNPASLCEPPNCALLTPAGVGFSGRSDTFESERDDYRIALDYRITDNLMLYSQFATGYKGGGFNPRPFYAMQIATFGEEEIETTEIGIKTQFANGRVRLNAAYFQNDQKGIQLNQAQCEMPVPAGGRRRHRPVDGSPYVIGPPCAKPQNVGDADVSGFELEMHIAATDGCRSTSWPRRSTSSTRASRRRGALVGRARRPRPDDARHDSAVHPRAHLERRCPVRVPAAGRRLVDGARRRGVPGRGVHRGGELRAGAAGERPEDRVDRRRTRCPTCG